MIGGVGWGRLGWIRLGFPELTSFGSNLKDYGVPMSYVQGLEMLIVNAKLFNSCMLIKMRHSVNFSHLGPFHS